MLWHNYDNISQSIHMWTISYTCYNLYDFIFLLSKMNCRVCPLYLFVVMKQTKNEWKREEKKKTKEEYDEEEVTKYN